MATSFFLFSYVKLKQERINRKSQKLHDWFHQQSRSSPLEAKRPSASIFPGMDVAVAQGLDWLGRDMEMDVEDFPSDMQLLSTKNKTS